MAVQFTTIRNSLAGIVGLFVVGVGVHEGLSLPVYYDSAGVKTVCYGETKNITKERYTLEECKQMLADSTDYYLKALDGLPPLPLTTWVGALDFTYNAGIGAFKGSQIRKDLMKGDVIAASKSVLNWRYISKAKISDADKRKGVWVWSPSKRKYNYDCSQLVNGKPNKVCYGLWTRRLHQSDMLSGKMSYEEAMVSLNGYY